MKTFDNGSVTLDTVIAGFEAALELERELGVRAVECDRTLLSMPDASAVESAHASARSGASSAPVSIAAYQSPAAPASPQRNRASSAEREYDFVFLHDRPLSSGGAQMMEKIVCAMKKTAQSAPIVTELPAPPARVYVVLGSFALKKFFPTLRGAPGQWLKSESGADVLVSNSPEYILRFGVETAAVKKIKFDMWRSLKTVEQRLAVV